MSKLDTFKKITSTVVGLGASKISNTIIKNNVQPDNAVDTVLVAAGSFAIGGIVMEASKEYTDRMIDELVDAYNQIRETTQN